MSINTIVVPTADIANDPNYVECRHKGGKVRYRHLKSGYITQWITPTAPVKHHQAPVLNVALEELRIPTGDQEPPAEMQAEAELTKLSKPQLIEKVKGLADHGVTNFSKTRKEQLITILIANGIYN